MFEPQYIRAFALPAACVLLANLPAAHSAISYSIVESPYFQNFDSLPNSPENVSLGTTASGIGWVDDSTTPPAGQFSIPGWYLYHPAMQAEGGASGNQRMRIGAGSANTGAFMSFGVSGTTERALGAVNSNTMATVGADMFFGLRLTNDTGEELQSFTLSYSGEQWRDGGAAIPNAQSLVFMWSTTATLVNDPEESFTIVPELGFTSPVFVNTGGGGAVDGNLTGVMGIGPITVEGINWQPGADLWLRWSDENNSGNDHGLAIDDLVFSASPIPEPGSFALLALTAAAVVSRRRRSQ